MPIAKFQMPDGRVARFEVPDGTTPEQAQSMMQAHFSAPEAAPSAKPETASIFKNGPIKIGKESFGDTLKQTLSDTDWGTRNIAGAGSAVMTALEGIKGLAGKTDDQQVKNQKIIAESAPVGNLAGNVAMLAPTAVIPGANTFVGAGTIGAVQGALLTPGDVAERAKAAGLGAAGSMVGIGISRAIGSSAPAAVSPNVRLLADEGVSLTPGQNAGGMLKAMEDKATSIPILGDVINSARKRGVEDFNRAAIRRVTDPMEQAGMPISANGVGNNAIADLRSGLGDAYDTILAKSSANATEPMFAQRMSSLRALVQGLPAKEQQAFDSVISREINGRMAPNGMVNAENLQAVKSGLGEQVKNFSASSDAYQRQLGGALKQAQAEFQDLIRRANPQNANDLKAIDTAYANFKRLQRAAGGVASEDGVFTPAQLHNAARALDKSKDKRAFSEGEALLQDLTSAGKDVLPSKVGDSGTAGRVAGNMFSLGGLVSNAGGLAAAIPAYLAYSRPGAAAINGVVNNGAVPIKNALHRLLQNQDVTRLLGASAPKLVSD